MILHHHLGLGDHFVCNGLVNFMARQLREPIFLPCKVRNYPTVAYLYSDNPLVKPFTVEGIDEVMAVESYAARHSLSLLRVGFEKCDLRRWDRSFYEQVGVDFVERYRSFHLPRSRPAVMIQPPPGPFILLHDEGSCGALKLRIKTDLPVVRVVPQEGAHLLSYLDLIAKAEEIHCIDSSVYHLVDSLVITTPRLFLHDVRKSGTLFGVSSKWNIVRY